MASGVAGLSTIGIPPFAPPPTTGGGGTTAAPAPGTSEPAGVVASPVAEPQPDVQKEAFAQPDLVTLPDGSQGIANPQRANFVNYFEKSGVGGYQDILNLYKSIHDGTKQNSNQPNGGLTNQLDNTPATSYMPPADTGAVATLPTTTYNQGYVPAVGSPSQVEPTITSPTGPFTPSPQTLPYTTPSPIGGEARPGTGVNTATGYVTTFGLNPNTVVNPDGTVDPKYYDTQDPNPTTAFGYDHHDPNLQGVSLPIEVIKASIGDYTKDPALYQAIKNGQYKVAVTNPNTGQTKIVNIVDAGPNQSTGNAVDVTWALQKALGFSGKNQGSVQLIGPNGATIPLQGYRPGLVTTGGATDTTTAATTKTTPSTTTTTTEQPAYTEESNALPEEATNETSGDETSNEASGALLPDVNATAGEFKEGGLVEKMQTGGMVGQQGQQQEPPPPMPPPPQQQQEFIAHIKGMVKGGKIPGKGEGDKVPALLEPGEFVLTKDAVKRIGVEKLEEMNHA